MALRQPEPALASSLRRREQIARRLLLEPLARVALVHARGLRELGRRQRAPLRQNAVQAEHVPDVDREEIERADRVREQPLDERVTAFAASASISRILAPGAP